MNYGSFLLYWLFSRLTVWLHKHMRQHPNIYPINGLTKMHKNSICLSHLTAFPLPLAASINSELNLKTISGPWRSLPTFNNHYKASALPCEDPNSIVTWWVDPPTRLIFTDTSGVTWGTAWRKTCNGFDLVCFLDPFQSSIHNKISQRLLSIFHYTNKNKLTRRLQ